mgnify:CR=1 FL=1
MGDLAERDEGGEVGKVGDRFHQERPASCLFHRQGLVLRREALHGVEDDRPFQLEPIAPVLRVNSSTQTVFIEGRVEQLARIIPGERPPRPVRSVLARRQPDDRQPGARIAERRHRGIPPFRLLLST